VSGRWAPRLESAAAGLVWAALLLGISVGALTVPVYTSAAVQTMKVPESAQLPIEDTVKLSGMVRALVADREFDPLPETWRGMPGFDAAAVSHLMDVRRVLDGARVATGLAAALLAGWVGWCVARRRWRPLAAGMRVGAAALLGLLVLAGLSAFLDFSSFFAVFHSLFFASGTWTFPYDSLLIRLFPERFWVASGLAWAVLSAAGAGGLLVAARFVPSGTLDGTRVALREEGASRTVDNV
jgi:integral membrane protein (TIGR01906 family)